MRNWIALGGLGTGLFVAALAGTLAVQGRLDYRGTRGVPLVSMLFEPPAEPVIRPDAEGGHEDQTTLRSGPRPAAPTPQEPEKETAAAEDGSDGLFAFPQLDSGFTVEDLERVLHAARRSEEASRLEQARLDAFEVDLLARERDLEDRATSIAEQMLRVDQERDRLERRIAEFERKVLLVERDELRGLREYGRSLASFVPLRAAALVMQEWESEDGRKRIVKVLAVMDPADADSILAALEETQVRDVLLERLRVVHEPRNR